VIRSVDRRADRRQPRLEVVDLRGFGALVVVVEPLGGGRLGGRRGARLLLDRADDPERRDDAAGPRELALDRFALGVAEHRLQRGHRLEPRAGGRGQPAVERAADLVRHQPGCAAGLPDVAELAAGGAARERRLAVDRLVQRRAERELIAARGRSRAASELGRDGG
jgi:hypothetical protein